MAQEAKPAEDAGQEPDQHKGQEPADDDRDKGQEPEPRIFDEEYVKQLRRDTAAARKRAAAAEARLKEIDDADKTEKERLTDRLTAAEKRAEEAEVKAIRYEVAAANGLDAKAAEFLTGGTREEIEARAAELGELLEQSKAAKAGKSGFDGGARKTADEKKDPGLAHNELLLRAAGRRP